MTNGAEELNAHDGTNAAYATSATRGAGGDVATDAVTELIDAARGVLGPVLAERPELARVVRALGRVLVEVAEGVGDGSGNGNGLGNGNGKGKGFGNGKGNGFGYGVGDGDGLGGAVMGWGVVTDVRARVVAR